MDIFYEFINKNFTDYKLKNITKAINSRNASTWGNTINKNPEIIYLIEKKVSNIIIFRNMNYVDNHYILLNKDRSLAFKKNVNIDDFINEISNFLGS